MKLDAVVLAAGTGSRMVELTRVRPKCLLPVGNHNLIWFAITGLRSIGISRIIILIPDIHEQDVKQYCHKKFNQHKDLTLEFVNVSTKADCGTAESILAIRDKIKEDFIVYSCDTIIDPKALEAVLNHYRLYDPLLTMLLSDDAAYFKPKSIPGRREMEKYTRDVVAVEPLERLDLNSSDGFSANKVVFLHSERDLGKSLKIKNRELALHPSLEVCSRFLDTHVYIFKRQVLDLMGQNEDRGVLKGEMIPLLVSKQFSKPERNLQEDDDEEISQVARKSNYENELKERLEIFNPKNVIQSDYPLRPKLPRSTACHALIVKNLTAFRVNTLGNYLSANRGAKTILGILGEKNLNFVKDCLVGDDTTIGEKCLLKGGSIGNNCKVGDKVRLINCIVMDNVEIESNTTLNETIVASNTKIGSKCDMKSCTVGYRQVIPNGTKANSEVFMDDGYVIDLSDPLSADNAKELGVPIKS